MSFWLALLLAPAAHGETLWKEWYLVTRKGAALSFSLKYASGSASLAVIMQDLESDAGDAGIKLTLSAQSGETITASDTSCTPSKATSRGCRGKARFTPRLRLLRTIAPRLNRDSLALHPF